MKKLLLIDNSIVIINVLKDLFGKKNEFDVFVAKSFKETKQLIESNSFFACISNIVLPDALNGELLSLLNKNKVPTIVVTSNLNDNVIKTLTEANVVDYISKDSIYELNSAYKLIELLVFMQGMEVLIVDDSAVIVAKLKSILESLLLTVHVAKNGKKALKTLEKNKNISLIITDHHMDEMDGLELIKNIRKKDIYSNTPILIMTTDNSNPLKIRFFKNGATDFLLKPILEEELKSKLVSIYSIMKQLFEINQYTKVINDNVIITSTDEKGTINYVSDAFCKITGYSREELIGQTHRLIRHPDMPDSLFEDLWLTINSKKIWQGEFKNLKKDGTSYWVSATIQPNLDAKGNITGFTSVRQDITDKKRIYELSITDPLTSLYNRRYFNELSPRYIDEVSRNNEVMALLILDIDNFKKYNDTYGHQMGDDVLIEVSTVLKNSFKRSDDKVFRLGGEEFGVLISAKASDNIINLSNNARENIENLKIEHSKNPPLGVLTASFGLCILEDNKKKFNIDEIYKVADDLLYKAKENGRNQVQVEIL